MFKLGPVGWHNSALTNELQEVMLFGIIREIVDGLVVNYFAFSDAFTALNFQNLVFASWDF